MAEKMVQLRMQMQQNNREVGDFLSDLDSWTKDIKKQDENLKSMKPSEKAVSVHPPVRSAPVVEKVKKNRDTNKTPKQGRIKSSDYSKWEKLDVDAMLKEVDEDEEKMEEEVQLEVEKLDAERKAKVAAEMKQKGNEHFKNAGYTAAIECYTTGMQADPSSPIFPANRAMAYLKLKRYAETEADCTLALSLDPTYTKAYLRRGTARVAVGKLSSARKDFADALKLEPGNGQAKFEIRKLDKIGDLEKVTNKKQPPKPTAVTKKKISRHVSPIFIHPFYRSRKPLMRVEVEEIGFEAEQKKPYIISDVHDEIAWENNKNNAQLKIKQEEPMISVMSERKSSSEGMSGIKNEEPRNLDVEFQDMEIQLTEKSPAAATREVVHVLESADEGGSGDQQKADVISLPWHGSETSKMDTIPEIGKAGTSAESEATKIKIDPDNRLGTDLKDLHGSSRNDPPVAGQSTSNNQVNIPPHPATSFQFQADVKRLSVSPEQLYLYLKQISPSHIPSLLKQQLETETLMPIVRCLHKKMNGNDIVFDYLQQFSQVRRFEMAIMFLSDQEKKDIHSFLHDLEKEFPARMEDTRGLRKRYGL